MPVRELQISKQRSAPSRGLAEHAVNACEYRGNFYGMNYEAFIRGANSYFIDL